MKHTEETQHAQLSQRGVPRTPPRALELRHHHVDVHGAGRQAGAFRGDRGGRGGRGGRRRGIHAEELAVEGRARVAFVAHVARRVAVATARVAPSNLHTVFRIVAKRWQSTHVDFVYTVQKQLPHPPAAAHPTARLLAYSPARRGRSPRLTACPGPPPSPRSLPRCSAAASAPSGSALSS